MAAGRLTSLLAHRLRRQMFAFGDKADARIHTVMTDRALLSATIRFGDSLKAASALRNISDA